MKHYRITEVSPDSAKDSIALCRKDILNLWKNNLSGSSEERFNWLYKENPAGGVWTWMAVDEDNNKTVGCNSLYPRYICKRGERLKIGIAVDFAINKEHRVFGPALKIQRAITSGVRKAGFAFSFAWPNDASKGVFLRAGYKILGEAGNWVKPLKTAPQLLRYIKIPFLAKMLGYFADKSLWLMDCLFLVNLPWHLTCEILKISDKRFDALWERGKTTYSIAEEKHSSYLNWRYTDCKAEPFQFFCLTAKESRELKGYLVYSIQNNIAKIWDLFAADNQEIAYLISEFIRQMRALKINSISITYLENGYLRGIIRRHNFSKRATTRACMVFIDANYPENDREFILDKNNWFLLEGDMDL